MMPPPFTSSAFTRSEAQYSIHAATSSVRGSRSLKLSCPQRRMVAYHGGGACSDRRGTARVAAPAAADRARNARRSIGSALRVLAGEYVMPTPAPAPPPPTTLWQNWMRCSPVRVDYLHETETS